MSRQNASNQIGKPCCPDCGAIIPAYPRYTPWCELCNWNLQPDSATSTDHQWQQHLANWLANRQLAQMRRQKPHKGITGSQIIALLSMVVVYLLHGLLLILAGNLILQGGIGRILIAIPLLYQTLRAIFIRYDELPRDMTVIDERHFPELFKHVREVAYRLTIPMPKIALSTQFTATFARIGPNRQPYLCIGIPFAGVLTHGELTALIGHELSHAYDGALTRSLHIQNARTALASWEALLSLRRWQWHTNPIITFGGRLLAIPTFPFWLMVSAFLNLLELLIYHDSQRSEYVADLQSFAVAGNRHAPTLLRKSYFRHLGALQQAYQHARQHQKYQAIQQTLAAIPEREKERVWRIAQMQQPKLRSTHPTVSQRLALIEAHNDIPPSIVLAPKAFAAIQAELRTWSQFSQGYEKAYLRRVVRNESVNELLPVSAD